MRLSAYPAYVPSETQWLPSLPAGWEVKPVKSVYREVDDRSEDGTEELLSVSAYYGVAPRREKIGEDEHISRAESLEGYKRCVPGDLVMNIMLAWNRGLGVTDYAGIVSPAYSVFRPKVCDLEPRYFHYLLRTDLYTGAFKQNSTGVIDSRLRLYPDVFRRMPLVLPPVSTQRAIAKFLDRETIRIDTMIAKQERLIEVLQEKRQALITQAVTKGLDPTAPMKDSGVEWLDMMPAHWDLLRVKSVSTLVTSGPRGWSDRVSDDGSLFVQSGELTDSLGIDLASAKRIVVEDDAEARRAQLRVGDVLVCITGAKTGKVAVCDQLDESAFINQHICLIRPMEAVLPMYLGAYLHSRAGQRYFETSQYGLKQGLGLEDVRNVSVPIPSKAEQAAIVERVNQVATQIGILLGKAIRSIALLQEHRSTLISAVVTGRVDVREAA